ARQWYRRVQQNETPPRRPAVLRFYTDGRAVDPCSARFLAPQYQRQTAPRRTGTHLRRSRAHAPLRLQVVEGLQGDHHQPRAPILRFGVEGMAKDAVVSEEMAKKFATEKDTPYLRWVRAEGLDVISAHYVPNLRTTELKPWPRRGGRGVFINHE